MAAAVAIFVGMSCGGKTQSSIHLDLCNCTPTEPVSADYRHAAKHVPIPSGQTPIQITVAEMLTWPQGASPPRDAPRSGRELQVFEIANAFLQVAYENRGDCDIHFEISDTADVTAPRAIVETPSDPEYCGARQNIQQQLAAHGFTLSTSGGTLPSPLPVSVLGLAFQDFEHNRGSKYVATVWELHPAIVTLH